MTTAITVIYCIGFMATVLGVFLAGLNGPYGDFRNYPTWMIILVGFILAAFWPLTLLYGLLKVSLDIGRGRI
jgi:hypothetical protein